MAWTRSDIEFTLFDEFANVFDDLEYSTAVDGTNVNMNSIFVNALVILELSITDKTAIVDADIANLNGDDDSLFLQLCRYYAMEKFASEYGNLADSTIGPRRDSYSQLAKNFAARAMKLRDLIDTQFAIFTTSMITGLITTDFQTKGDDEDPDTWV